MEYFLYGFSEAHRLMDELHKFGQAVVKDEVQREELQKRQDHIN